MLSHLEKGSFHMNLEIRRSFWIIRWTLNPITNVLIRKRQKEIWDTEEKRRRHRKEEEAACDRGGRDWSVVAQVMECWQPPEAEIGKEQTLLGTELCLCEILSYAASDNAAHLTPWLQSGKTLRRGSNCSMPGVSTHWNYEIISVILC